MVSGPRPEVNFTLPTASGGKAVKGSRLAYFPEYGRFVETPVYNRYALAPGATFTGPAIIEERESTVVVGVRGQVRVDEHLNVIVEFADA